jgi:putative ABC transport system permease protein
MMAAVGMLLLIGCANLANLTLARATAREREIAVRAAMGAGRGRLIRQFLTENVLLALAGGVLGIGVAYATMAALLHALPPNSLPREVDVRMDGRVLLFAFIVSALTGILFGLAPALGVTRINLASSLKENARGAIGGARKRMRSALVVAEIALSFILLVGAGLLIRSFFRMQHADLGFDTTNVLTAGLNIANKRFPEPERLNQEIREILASVRSMPGVRDAAFSSALPLQGWGYGMPFEIGGRPEIDRANRPDCFFKMISPSYFLSLGMRLKSGRGLNERDVAGSPPVAVINETMVRKFFKAEEPIGKRIMVQQIVPGKTQLGQEVGWEVVGVVADEQVTSLDNKNDNPGMYVTNEQSPVYFGGLVVRSTIDPSNLERALQRAVYNVDKDQPVTNVKLLEQIKSESMVGQRLESVLMGVFAGVALLLSSVGIYGVISYSVAQRTGEIGIRAALGASNANLLVLILRNALWMTGIGLVLGLAGALALTRLIAALLFGVGAYDTLTLASVIAILGCVGLIASYIPARRAVQIDPVDALRHE